jgi:hypothetical protein
MLAACASSNTPAKAGGAHRDPCASQVIITFTQNQGTTPNSELIEQIARAASVQLSYVRTAGPGLYVFSLSTAEADPSCEDALRRLRRDARVRSVDVDAHRRALA